MRKVSFWDGQFYQIRPAMSHGRDAPVTIMKVEKKPGKL